MSNIVPLVHFRSDRIMSERWFSSRLNNRWETEWFLWWKKSSHEWNRSELLSKCTTIIIASVVENEWVEWDCCVHRNPRDINSDLKLSTWAGKNCGILCVESVKPCKLSPFLTKLKMIMEKSHPRMITHITAKMDRNRRWSWQRLSGIFISNVILLFFVHSAPVCKSFLLTTK